MFGQNYKIINQSIEMFDDFNDFLTRNAPNSFMAANVQGAHSNNNNNNSSSKHFQRKSSRYSCRNSPGEIDWELEIEKERDRFRDDHYSYTPGNNPNGNYFTNRTLRPRNKNYYDSS